ncbi:MAG: T9SS type A sorting domain-containing protein [Muribaculum sp.]|nr:T9SS type A sorting domain-containing protein [Muribaculum sp.]
MIVTFETVDASRIRVTQTENTSGGYWSIHEAYIADLAPSAIYDVISDTGSVKFSGDDILLEKFPSLDSLSISIYDLNGKLVDRVVNPGRSYSVGHIAKGIYIVEISCDGLRRKILKIKK